MDKIRYKAHRIDVDVIENLDRSEFGAGDLIDSPSPELTIRDNTVRAGYTVPALLTFAETVGLKRESADHAISDLLGNLAHLSDALGYDFDALLERGFAQYESEVEG